MKYEPEFCDYKKVTKRFFVRDGLLSVADYNSTLMGVVVVVYFFTMG
jgi:hypothetical protein